MNARRQIVLCLVQTLRTLAAHITDRQIEDAVRTHPDGEIFTSLFKDPNSFLAAAEMLAEIGDCRGRYPPATRSPATPARPRTRSSPASARPRASAGGATSACAPRSPGSRTPPVTGTRGRRICTPPPSPAATTIRARYAPSDAPGLASCGAVGKTVSRMTPPATPLQRHITVTIPTPSGPVPDTAATQRMAGAAVTRRAVRRAERAALDGKSTSAKPGRSAPQTS